MERKEGRSGVHQGSPGRLYFWFCSQKLPELFANLLCVRVCELWLRVTKTCKVTSRSVLSPGRGWCHAARLLCVIPVLLLSRCWDRLPARHKFDKPRARSTKPFSNTGVREPRCFLCVLLISSLPVWVCYWNGTPPHLPLFSSLFFFFSFISEMK